MNQTHQGRAAVLLSGRGTNFEALFKDSLERDSGYRIVLVLSDCPDAPGLLRAGEYGIEAIHVDPTHFASRRDFNRKLLMELNEHSIDLVCLAGYMRILGREVVRAYPHRILNIHPSLLPAFSGLDAQLQALEYGVRYSGCTVHFVDEGLDSGPVVLQQCVEVLRGDSVDSLSQRILTEEHRLFPRAVRLFFAGRLVVEGRQVRILS